MRKKSKSTGYLLAAFALLILYGLIRITPIGPFIDSTLSRFLQPISAPVYSLGQSISALLSQPTDLALLADENAELRDQVLELQQELSQLQIAKQENESLKQLLDFHEESALLAPKHVARIVGRDPDSQSILLLNIGQRDGVELHNAVTVNEGIMIAKIIDVSARSSKALLLTDNQSAVAVTISGGAPSNKLVRGERGLSLFLDQVPQGEVMYEGQLVVTSGLEQSIPKGLIVGEIEEIISEPNDLFQKAVLRPLTDFQSIEFVSVITPTED